MKEKQEFLSGINNAKRERSPIFSALKKSSFLKSMILIKFQNWWYSNILIQCYYLVSNKEHALIQKAREEKRKVERQKEYQVAITIIMHLYKHL